MGRFWDVRAWFEGVAVVGRVRSSAFSRRREKQWAPWGGFAGGGVTIRYLPLPGFRVSRVAGGCQGAKGDCVAGTRGEDVAERVLGATAVSLRPLGQSAVPVMTRRGVPVNASRPSPVRPALSVPEARFVMSPLFPKCSQISRRGAIHEAHAPRENAPIVPRSRPCFRSTVVCVDKKSGPKAAIKKPRMGRNPLISPERWAIAFSSSRFPAISPCLSFPVSPALI